MIRAIIQTKNGPVEVENAIYIDHYDEDGNLICTVRADKVVNRPIQPKTTYNGIDAARRMKLNPIEAWWDAWFKNLRRVLKCGA